MIAPAQTDPGTGHIRRMDEQMDTGIEEDAKEENMDSQTAAC